MRKGKARKTPETFKDFSLDFDGAFAKNAL